jgi:NAD(P)-dependent dehydrogenase (short-subunit alcohol dehydrogenase family)
MTGAPAGLGRQPRRHPHCGRHEHHHCGREPSWICTVSGSSSWATSGIGLATAKAARCGAEVTVISRQQEASVDRALAELPPGTRGRAADLTDPALVGRLFGDLACAVWKSSAEISGSWAMMSDQTQRPASFQRIRVS